MKTSAFAPAKVNLFLHVGPVAKDGYHPLVSWMSFADIGDRLAMEPAEAPGLVLDGPFAGELRDLNPGGNLAWRAAEKLMQRAKSPVPPFRLILTKALPVAAGLGGGSADAGAALRLVRDALRLTVGEAELAGIAAELGADGPACLAARPVIGEGRGERLSPAPKAPTLDAVLVNPGVACSTAAVYRSYDAAGATGGADHPDLPDRFEGAEELAAFLAGCRNDLEAPAIGVAPEIDTVLSTLRAQPEILLARLSGSGATCFAICAGDIEAETLAERVTALRPEWWVRRCRLGGPWPDR